MDLPLFPAPAGYLVDMENPQRMGAAVNFWVGGVGMFLATTFLSIRIYTKTFLARSFAADDSKSMRIRQLDGDLEKDWTLTIHSRCSILMGKGRYASHASHWIISVADIIGV